MRYQVAYRGTPIGQADFIPVGLAIADFEPYVAYESIREVIRQASEFIWAIGVFGTSGVTPRRVPEQVLARAAALSFEIRDPFGELVDADWVNVIERPAPSSAPVLVARFRHAHGGVAGEPQPGARSDGNREGDRGQDAV